MATSPGPWIRAARAAAGAIVVLALAGPAVGQPVDIPPTWANATLDLQIIEPALSRFLDSSGRLQT